jgi:hypothetical protein
MNQPTKTASITKQPDVNADADNMKIEHGMDFCTKKIDELRQKKLETLEQITIKDIQEIGIELQEFRKVTKDDVNYIKVRDSILVPEINMINQAK